VEANFGSEDFKFNIDSVLQDEKRNFLVKMDAQPLDCAASIDLVMSWLIHKWLLLFFYDNNSDH